MAAKLIKGALAGGVVIWLWSSVWWMGLPFATGSYSTFTDTGAVAEAVVSNAPSSGVYTLPAMGDPAAMEGNYKGPLVFTSVRKEGTRSFPSLMGFGLLLNVLCAGFMTWLLSQTTERTMMGHATFAAVVAIAGVMILRFADANWWGFPAGFAITALFENGIGWFLAGMAISKAAKV